jgi:SAM-dependent methyltransferase
MMKTIQRNWDWWAYLYRVVHRSQIPGISHWDDALVDLIVQVLNLQPGDRVLDLACGSGDHARRLARRGMHVLGVDIADSLIAHCRQKAEEESISTAGFEQDDMREIAYEGEFKAVLLLSGSFGFFDDATNRDVLARMVRALETGGRVLIDVSDPSEMVVRPPRQSWSEYGDGYGLRKTWWEPQTCTYVSEFMFIDSDGLLNTAAEPERIRFYSLPEWRTLFSETGLVMTHSLADTKLPLVPYGIEHYGNLVLVGEKR